MLLFFFYLLVSIQDCINLTRYYWLTVVCGYKDCQSRRWEWSSPYTASILCS